MRAPRDRLLRRDEDGEACNETAADRFAGKALADCAHLSGRDIYRVRHALRAQWLQRAQLLFEQCSADSNNAAVGIHPAEWPAQSADRAAAKPVAEVRRHAALGALSIATKWSGQTVDDHCPGGSLRRVSNVTGMTSDEPISDEQKQCLRDSKSLAHC